MLQFFCHPALENLLNTSRHGTNCVTLPISAIVISDYLPQVSSPIHAGLLQAVNYRLTHHSEYIFIASFFLKEKLLHHDKLGILSLPGTEFVRLPFDACKFYDNLGTISTVECVIPDQKWIEFATNASKTLLREKLSVLKHDEAHPLYLINSLTGPLGSAARGCSKIPTYFSVVKQQLQLVRHYIAKKEIVELIALSNASANLPDFFLQTVAEFVKKLMQLEFYVDKKEINIDELISDIDELNKTFSKIIIL